MRIVELQNAFGIDHLKHGSRPIPSVDSPHQVLIRMKAASLNYRDYLMVQGQYNPRQRLPLIPVSDGVGIVEAIGTRVTRAKVGGRVNPTFAQGWLHGVASNQFRHITLGGPLDGTLSEYMLLHEDGLVMVPEYLSDTEAATLPCAAVTAWNAIIEQGHIQPGDTVVIQGTGGVALFALQFAKRAGAFVYQLSKSDQKLERAKQLGADVGVNYITTPDWGKTIRNHTGGGADFILELGGASTLQQSIRAIRPGGCIAMIGVLGGPKAELLLPLVVMQNIRLQGVTVGSRTLHETMLRAMRQHQIHPIVDQVFPFDQTPEAFYYMASGQHFGKICIEIG